MTREIKFRVWDKKDKRMYEPFPLDWLKEKSDRPTNWNEGINFDESIIFLQYTGLKDKNGKEIYEGDIVKWTDPSFKELKKEHKILKVPDITKIDPMGKQDEQYLKIIGNVHEHPHLLKT